MHDVLKRPVNAKAVVAVICWIIIIWFVVAFVNNVGKEQAAKEAVKPKTTYLAALGAYAVLDPKTVKVEVRVKNVSDVAGHPSCIITVSSTSGAYTGSTGFDTVSIEPGKEITVTPQVPVGDNGAAFITSGHAECIEK